MKGLPDYIQGLKVSRCRLCGRAGRLEVDHVIPVFRGGVELDAANCQTLCKPCHLEKSRRERSGPETPARAAWRALASEIAQ